ncbi:hypothetical protein GCM10009747_27320 [Agromyces humatus]|uniref:Uncharacterized protein n=1 Tax=Agromyces humatus TaxID=279573 RepID=A0ABN2KWL9_9MICO
MPQPTTAMRAPRWGSRAWSSRRSAARAQVSGCEASSAAMWAAGLGVDGKDTAYSKKCVARVAGLRAAVTFT